ncbi:MAG TPA: hypothetical protein VE090_02530 [Methylomirabilota bacterium]|nr:hypothetical protein [Methylomirabilota bacterium]
MGRQQKLKAQRRADRFMQAFLNDVAELSKTNQHLKELWEAVVRLKREKAEQIQLSTAVDEFSKEFARAQGINMEQLAQSIEEGGRHD